MLQSGESAMDFEEFGDLQAARVKRAKTVNRSKALRSITTTESEDFFFVLLNYDLAVLRRPLA